MIRNHVAWSQTLAKRLAAEPDFEIVTQPFLSLFSFDHKAPAGTDQESHTQRLIAAINNDGRIYLTQTRVRGRLVVRFQAGQFETTAEDVDMAFATIVEIARSLPSA